MIKLDEETLRAVADSLSDPYPEEVFTPLSREEIQACVRAMEEHSGVQAPSDRLHAGWARHWSSIIREMDAG